MLRSILHGDQIELGADHTTVLLDDRHRRALKIAAEQRAYTLVGRIPFLGGKMPNDGLVVMVAGDSRLRRPYVVAVTIPVMLAGARVSEATRLQAFLRSEETQAWIANFGKGRFDERPLFFRVTVGATDESRE